MANDLQIRLALDALVQGRLIIVLDDDREMEGDFVGAAEQITPAMVDFMITHGRGQLCVPVLPDVAERLNLTPMVPDAGIDFPRFTIPIDHRNCRTGISPVERSATIQSMADPSSRENDFERPGHVFPLIARSGGVLERPGHTEAAVDLARMAGMSAMGVLCEICSSDGRNMASGPELHRLARRFDLPMITVNDVIKYRRSTDSMVVDNVEAFIPQELAG